MKRFLIVSFVVVLFCSPGKTGAADLEIGYSTTEIVTLCTSLQNESGSAIPLYSVVVLDPGYDRGIKVSSSSTQTGVLGVALEEIPNGSWGRIAVGGRFNVLVKSELVNRGDYLETSDEPGFAQSQGQTAGKGAFAIALHGNGGTGNQVEAMFIKAEVW